MTTPLTFNQAKVVPFVVDDIRLSIEVTSSKGLRLNVATFGDGYQQTALDGLNNQLERWSCTTVPMSANEAWGLESFILSTNGTPFLWTPPDSTKVFRKKVSGGQVNLGYKNLASCTLDSYTNPTDYTVDLVNGVVTSVTIPNDTVVVVNAELGPRYYQPASEWTTTELAPDKYVISFELKRVYV